MSEYRKFVERVYSGNNPFTRPGDVISYHSNHYHAYPKYDPPYPLSEDMKKIAQKEQFVYDERTYKKFLENQRHLKTIKDNINSIQKMKMDSIDEKWLNDRVDEIVLKGAF
jgi:hypothetical protein